MEAQTPHQLYNFENATQMYNSLKKVLNTVAENLGQGYTYQIALDYVSHYVEKNNVDIKTKHKMEIAYHLFKTTGWDFFEQEENKMISSHNRKRK